MLPPMIETQHANLADLCRKSFVRKLDLFGSAAHGFFDPLRSDLDFLVEFAPLEPKAYAHVYFQLKEGLETLFRRNVDLVTDDDKLVCGVVETNLDPRRQTLNARLNLPD